jgi:hypothetical protein
MSNSFSELIMAFLSNLITTEVAATIQESTLFRGNSVCSAFISSFCRLVGLGTRDSFVCSVSSVCSAFSSSFCRLWELYA